MVFLSFGCDTEMATVGESTGDAAKNREKRDRKLPLIGQDDVLGIGERESSGKSL
jgi:hypothetical protein